MEKIKIIPKFGLDPKQPLKTFYNKLINLFNEEYPEGDVGGSVATSSTNSINPTKIHIHLISPEGESDEKHTEHIDNLLDQACGTDYCYEVELTTGYIPDDQIPEADEDEDEVGAGRSYYGISVWPAVNAPLIVKETISKGSSVSVGQTGETSFKKIRPIIQNKSQLSPIQMQEVLAGLEFYKKMATQGYIMVTSENGLDQVEKQMVTVNNKFRDHVRQKFVELFVRNQSLFKNSENIQVQWLPSLIEREIVIYSIKRCQLRTADWVNPVFQQFYLHKSLSIRDNLDPLSYIENKNLLPKLINLTIGPRDLVVAQPHELFPERWIQIQEERLRLAEASSKQSMAGTTTLFKCGRCKGQICRYMEQQTRSCDEAMTTFITCMNCGNRWKE